MQINLFVGMKVTTDYIPNQKDIIRIIEKLEPNDKMQSKWVVTLTTPKCEHCGFKCHDLINIDSGWCKPLVQK